MKKIQLTPPDRADRQTDSIFYPTASAAAGGQQGMQIRIFMASNLISLFKKKKNLFLLSSSSAMYSSSIIYHLLLLLVTNSVSAAESPKPTPWPLQFHSILYVNYSGSLSLIDLWYDWPNGRNFNIIQDQLGQLLYDLEWNNGTSFVYTKDSTRKCRTAQLEVGILRPNWLDGAVYLGQQQVDGFLCNVWQKIDFIWYYEDVATKRPVHWVFYTGRSIHLMTFEVGAVLEDIEWQAPVYCFENVKEDVGSRFWNPKPQGLSQDII